MVKKKPSCYYLCNLTSVNSLMLMLFACLATILLASSREDTIGWDMAEGGLLVMEGSGSSVDRGPILDKAAVMVAIK